MSDRSEHELRQSIEESRSRMAETVEEIGARVNPDRVRRELKARARDEVDEFKTNVKRKARSTMKDLEHGAEEKGRGMWRAIKDNPVPATMVGVGLAWLMANGRKSDDYAADRWPRSDVHGYGFDIAPGYEAGPGRPAGRTRTEIRVGGEYGDHEDDSGVRERVEELADEARERGSQALDRAEAKAQSAMDATREKTSELGQEAREQARHARDRAEEWTNEVQQKTVRAERRVEDAVRDNPLAAGAMAAALGLAAGLMVPETRREHELLGATRDRVLDRAQSSAMKAADKVRETASESAGDAARKAVDSAFPGANGDEKREQENAVAEPGRS